MSEEDIPTYHIFGNEIQYCYSCQPWYLKVLHTWIAGVVTCLAIPLIIVIIVSIMGCFQCLMAWSAFTKAADATENVTNRMVDMTGETIVGVSENWNSPKKGKSRPVDEEQYYGEYDEPRYSFTDNPDWSDR